MARSTRASAVLEGNLESTPERSTSSFCCNRKSNRIRNLLTLVIILTLLVFFVFGVRLVATKGVGVNLFARLRGVRTSQPSTKPSVISSISPTQHPSIHPSQHPTNIPSVPPTDNPSQVPSTIPTSNPSSSPSTSPSTNPTHSPSIVPSKNPSVSPSIHPTKNPTSSPSIMPTTLSTKFPTKFPTKHPTPNPTNHPTNHPTDKPTNHPTRKPTRRPTNHPTNTPTVTDPTLSPTMNFDDEKLDPKFMNTLYPTFSKVKLQQDLKNTLHEDFVFYMMGDIPYNPQEHKTLVSQLQNIPSDAAFVTHVGDIMKASNTFCVPELYSNVRSALSVSQIPLFLLPGDNDWTKCPNPKQSWGHWNLNFHQFESTFWDVRHLNVKRPQVNPMDATSANFAFFQKGVLVVGINMVAGPVHDEEEWAYRHHANYLWTINQVNIYKDFMRALVINSHAGPNATRASKFFNPLLKDLEAMDFNPKSVLLVHGNGHTFENYTFNKINVIQVDAGMKGRPLRITVAANNDKKMFQVER